MNRQTLLLLILLAPLAWSQEPADDAADKVAQRVEAAAERLDLSDEQRDQLREILMTSAEKQRSIMASHGVTPESRAAGEQPSRKEIRAMRSEMKQAREATDEKVAAVLTEEQMNEYRAMREEAQAQMRQRMKEKQ